MLRVSSNPFSPKRNKFFSFCDVLGPQTDLLRCLLLSKVFWEGLNRETGNRLVVQKTLGSDLLLTHFPFH